MEVCEGVHALRAELGSRWLTQYLLVGERTLLFDTGVKGSAQSLIYPYMQSIGLSAKDLTYVLISHADVDHFGDNATIRKESPNAVFISHQDDATLLESTDRIMNERYGWYGKYDLSYPPETLRWLQDVVDADVPMDLTVRGEEWIRLSDNWSVQILHLPGHSLGHLGLWDPVSRTAIVMDAVMGNGLLNRDGQIISPPPYFDAELYRTSIHKLIQCQPEYLYTAHYLPMHGHEVSSFLSKSLEFIDRVDEAILENLKSVCPLTLRNLTDLVNRSVGPFIEMANELAGPVLAHLKTLTRQGHVSAFVQSNQPHWFLL